MKAVLVNDRWPLWLPEHRAERPEWPWWERERLQAMWTAVRRSDVVWDIGAESGDLSALYASWGADVVLCEPSARQWPTIRATWEANALPMPLACWPGFVGNPDHSLGWMVSGEWPAWAEADMDPEAGFVHLNEQPGPDEHSDEGPIACISVDAMVQSDVPFPQVITIDVEGAELEVLQGAAGTLWALRPLVFVSVHPQFMWDRYGQTSDDLMVLMTKLLNYEAKHLHTDHEEHWCFRPRAQP